MKLIEYFMNEGMRRDHEFYMAHKEELYYYGEIACGVLWSTMMILGSFLAIRYNPLFLIISVFSAWAFGDIHHYLHLRKEHIEIKDLLRKGEGNEKI